MPKKDIIEISTQYREDGAATALPYNLNPGHGQAGVQQRVPEGASRTWQGRTMHHAVSPHLTEQSPAVFWATLKDACITTLGNPLSSGSGGGGRCQRYAGHG